MTDVLQCAIVSLLIDEDDLDPQEITDLFGGKPRLAVRKGEVFTARNGRQRTATTGMWQFGDDWENAPSVGSQIEALFGQLTQNLDIWKSVTSWFHCYVSVGSYFDGWTGGITLDPHVLMLVAERGLAIDFDLYAPAASDAEEMQ